MQGEYSDGSDWVRVSRGRPCPICQKPDWCLVAADAGAAICSRKESGKRCGEAGWLHPLRDEPPPRTRPRPRTEGTTDWSADAARYAAALTPERLEALAADLGLPADALATIPYLGWLADPPLGPCYTFPETDAAGTVIGITRRFLDGRKMAIRGSKRGLTLPAGWSDRPGPVLPVEGPTDAAALAACGLAGIGRPSNTGGVALLAKLIRTLPAERPVIVIGENDQKVDGSWPGRTGAETVAGRLGRQLRRPVLWTLPPHGSKDVRAWLTAGAKVGTPWPDQGRDLLAHLTATVESEPLPDLLTRFGRDTEPPRIVIDTAEYRVNAQAAAALGREPDLYARAGMLVRVVEDPAVPEPNGSDPTIAVRRPEGGPVIRDLSPALLRERLTRCADWVVLGQRDGEVTEKPAHPPTWSVQAVHAHGNWPAVRRLEAVVTHPALLSDGSVLAAAGYDRASGLLLALPPGLAVNTDKRPDRAAVAAALADLWDVVGDFPFETSAHRAAWLAGLLTPLSWFAFQGPAPLFLIDKNVRGAGAGLLADVIATIVTGRRFPVMTYTNDREELRKKITSLAAEGERLVLLDNLAGAVGSDVLDAALTSDRWKDRLLGGNRLYDGPLHVCWFGTGNNVQLAADTARRVCHVRMETTEERPELRTGFKYPDLRAHVRENRGPLLSAALTILRGWVAAGRPRHDLPAWGSFEGWSGVVRETVVFAGLPDPGETRLALQTAADRDAAAMTGLLVALEQLDTTRRGLTTAEIIDRLKNVSDSPPDWYADLRAGVEDLCGKLDGRTLGYRFRHFARRNFAGRMLDKSGEPHGANRWVVVPVRAAGPAGRSPPSPPSPPTGPPAGGDGGHGGDGSARSESPRPRRELFDHQRLPD